MRKQFRTVAIMALLASLSAGCQKERVAPVIESEAIGYGFANVTKRTVCYTVDGVNYQVTLTGDAAWNDFLRSMLDMAEHGCTVTVSAGNGTTQQGVAKEVVTYTTANKDDAVAWCDNMINNGYAVTMIYDSENGVFICTAERK